MDKKPEKIKLKRLSMWIPEAIHKEVGVLTAIRGCTITDYVTRLIVKSLVEESKYK